MTDPVGVPEETERAVRQGPESAEAPCGSRGHVEWAGAAARLPDVSVVLGSLDRRRLLRHAIRSVRENGFPGKIEIIVIDGGSTDGTCEWLARQPDILTIVQPNYKVRWADGALHRTHTWGKFMNLGFRAAAAPWVLMISDDLLLCRGAIQTGLDALNWRIAQGEKIGGGAIFYREYPRDDSYHVKLLPGGIVHINHGFYRKEALEEVGYSDETNFKFYGADGDLAMRLSTAGWATIPLEGAYAEHLLHRTNIWARIWRKPTDDNADADMALFHERWAYLGDCGKERIAFWSDPDRTGRVFWRTAPLSCLEGVLRRRFLRR